MLKEKTKNILLKRIAVSLFLLCSILFVIRFQLGALLRLYIKSGIGDCSKIPILCMQPADEINYPQIDQEYIDGFIRYDFSDLSVRLPKGFMVVQGEEKKVYYKRKKKQKEEAAIYLLRRPEGFFVNLYPQLKKSGVNDDYEFIRRTMFANQKSIHNIPDAFFVIMKSIFIPDLGDQSKAVMSGLRLSGGMNGFINYNLDAEGNYFDCNLFDSKGNFFKAYIKDVDSHLSLDQVLAALSTLKAK